MSWKNTMFPHVPVSVKAEGKGRTRFKTEGVLSGGFCYEILPPAIQGTSSLSIILPYCSHEKSNPVKFIRFHSCRYEITADMSMLKLQIPQKIFCCTPLCFVLFRSGLNTESIRRVFGKFHRRHGFL